MKTIQNIDVRVTYSVRLSNVEVSDDVYDALINNDGNEFDCNDYNLTEEELKVEEWLIDHIHEQDAYEWSHIIEEIE